MLILGLCSHLSTTCTECTSSHSRTAPQEYAECPASMVSCHSSQKRSKKVYACFIIVYIMICACVCQCVCACEKSVVKSVCAGYGVN